MRGRGNKAVGYVIITFDNFEIKILISVSLHVLKCLEQDFVHRVHLYLCRMPVINRFGCKLEEQL
jgi:hypothetical protein